MPQFDLAPIDRTAPLTDLLTHILSYFRETAYLTSPSVGSSLRF